MEDIKLYGEGKIAMTDRKGSKPTPEVKEHTGYYDVPERYEIIDGIRYDFLSSPKITHQVLLGQLYTIIQSTCHSSGVIIFAPMDVHLSEDNIVQPDLIYISNDNLSIMKNEKVMGAPDLLVEILSPSTGARDKVRKKELYARFGVQEYWIVDPVHAAVDQFVLVEAGSGYALSASYDTTDTIVSNKFPCLAVKMDELFDSIAKFRTEE